MKILLLDIETAPHLATVWGLWGVNVGINQLLKNGYTICWAAKWLDDEEIMFSSIQESTMKGMVKGIHKLLDEADIVVHYNGQKFDIPTLNREFVLHGLPPPAPYKQIDLLKEVKRNFRFASNKLDYVSQFLGLGSKTEHKGHELWLGCMEKDEASWNVMKEYNKQDVNLLEKLYKRLRGWIKGPANMATMKDEFCCPNCGGHHFQKRGFAYTAVSTFQRYQCKSCKTWFRDNHNLRERGTLKALKVKE